MFDGASNIQIGERILKAYDPKLTVMRGVEHTVSLFFNDISRILVVYQIISAHKLIYNIFGSDIYQNQKYYKSSFGQKSFDLKWVSLKHN